MFNYNIQDLQILFDFIIVCSIVFFIFMLFVWFAIIRMSSHLKDLVDLEFRKYKELNVKGSIDDRPESDKLQQ